MSQHIGDRLDRVLDQVEGALLARGGMAAEVLAFIEEPDGRWAVQELPTVRAEADAEALAAIVLTRVLEASARACAIASPVPDEPQCVQLDAHVLEHRGVCSRRRTVRVPGPVASHGTPEPAGRHLV